jgi:hypothetical protein
MDTDGHQLTGTARPETPSPRDRLIMRRAYQCRRFIGIDHRASLAAFTVDILFDLRAITYHPSL